MLITTLHRTSHRLFTNKNKRLHNGLWQLGLEEGTKQADGIYIGKINYKVALINSKGLHAPVSDGNPRCILRNVFNHTSYQEVKDVLKEHFKCGSG